LTLLSHSLLFGRDEYTRLQPTYNMEGKIELGRINVCS